MEKKGSKRNLKKRPSFFLLLPSEHDHIMFKIRSSCSNYLEHEFTMPSLFLFQIFYHIKNIKQRDINMKEKNNKRRQSSLLHFSLQDINLWSLDWRPSSKNFDTLNHPCNPSFSLIFLSHNNTKTKRKRYERKPIREDNLFSYLFFLQDINFWSLVRGPSSMNFDASNLPGLSHSPLVIISIFHKLLTPISWHMGRPPFIWQTRS